MLPIPNIWNKLKLTYSKVPKIHVALKNLFFGSLKKNPGIEQRIAIFQKKTYGTCPLLTPGDVETYNFTLAEEERIAYYLGEIGTNKVSVDKHHREFSPDTTPFMLALVDAGYLHGAAVTGKIRDGYTLPLLNIFRLIPPRYKEKKFLYRYGDHWEKSRFRGVIAKTRAIGDPSVTLLNLNPVRHWKRNQLVASLDLAYQHKRDLAIWRGATTGKRKTRGKRSDLVEMFFDDRDRFDVGYSFVVDPPTPGAHLVKGHKSIEELLGCKFLICVEGNDVASGLKWMLHSNSVVMMPRPTTSSWLMEDKLEPFVHYIPLADDFSDANERFDWAINHEDECMKISHHASQFIAQFLDPEKEVLIECAVMRRYLDNLEVY